MKMVSRQKKERPFDRSSTKVKWEGNMIQKKHPTGHQPVMLLTNRFFSLPFYYSTFEYWRKGGKIELEKCVFNT
jgi:uncharacterized protein YqjF (DUF2071 family)